MELCENSRNTIHIMRQMCTRITDIFLFDILWAQKMDFNKYKILEHIKDGSKYDGKKLIFKKPNVVIVFSTKAPDMSKLSKDRWLILKISDDHEKLENVTK